MSSFKLPSGRVVELRDSIGYLEELEVMGIGVRGSFVEFALAKIGTVAPEFADQGAVESLSQEDGHALAAEVNKRFDGRPEAKEAPFGRGSRRSSRGSEAATRRR